MSCIGTWNPPTYWSSPIAASASATLASPGHSLTRAATGFSRSEWSISKFIIRHLRILCTWGRMRLRNSRAARRSSERMSRTSWLETVRGGKQCSVTCRCTSARDGIGRQRYLLLRNSMISRRTYGVWDASYTSLSNTFNTARANRTSGKSSNESDIYTKATPVSHCPLATRTMTIKTKKTQIKIARKKSTLSAKMIRIWSYLRISASKVKLI